MSRSGILPGRGGSPTYFLASAPSRATRRGLSRLLDRFPDLGFEQCPHGASTAPPLVMRIVPNQRQQSDDNMGSDRDAQRVRRDHLTKLKAMLRQRQLPIQLVTKRRAARMEARQVTQTDPELSDPFRFLKNIIAGLVSDIGRSYSRLHFDGHGCRMLVCRTGGPVIQR